MSSLAKVPTIVLGGTGYVAGELLRLIAAHPRLELRAVLSDSQPGELVAKSFAHLAPVYPKLTFSSLAEVTQLVSSLPQSAVLSAAPHGVAAKLIDDLLTAAEAKGAKPRVIDISADYRYSSAGAYEAVYKHAHGAPQRIEQFSCAVPEHLDTLTRRMSRIRAALRRRCCLRAYRCIKLGLVEPRLFVSGITGSTGSGRTPGAGTHHPQRHSDLYAYNPLSHRHTPEIKALARAASSVDAQFNFVPHSGPFARGIHVTVQATATRALKSPELLEALGEFYRGKPFVRVAARAAAHQGCRDEQLRVSERRRQWRHGCSDVRHRQSHEGRRGGRHPVAQPSVRLRRDHRPHRACSGLDVRERLAVAVSGEEPPRSR